ncbi:ATP-binding protein [Deferribacter abyssi]|uniref:ATP-binding protein n=1 Tax=Deferribacter abyssi TaxID=213806 RepID=UPI003C1D45F8
MKITIKIIILLNIAILLILTPFYLILWNNQKQLIMKQAKIQAKTLFNMILITRQWVAENRDKIKPVPAVATKELSKYALIMSNFRFHITSDKLVNPENKPDEFEKYALKLFREGKKEVEKIELDEKYGKVYRYMAPLYINKSCIQCHHYQGYKIGELRGGISVFIPLKDIIHNLRQQLILFIISGITMYLFLNIMLIVLLKKSVLNPLKSLESATKEIEKRNFNIYVDLKTKDEFEDLANAFNMMIKELRIHESELKNKINHAVGKYAIALEELKKTNENLKKMNQFKSDIIDSLAHEVRTPLTKLISCTDIIQSSNNRTQIERCLEIILRNSRILKDLFDKIILLNKLEYSTYDFTDDEVDIKNLIDYVLSKYKLEIENKHIKIIQNIDVKTFYSDHTLMEFLLSNLISNAIKYNKDNGLIEIETKFKDNYLVLSIKDTGIGIPEKELENIFKRFYRISDIKKQYPGLGLGLSIVKRIVDHLGGELFVKSEENKYTHFIIKLPIK